MRLDRFSEKKGYLDVGEARVTMDLLEGFRRFDHPTLLVWAKDDPHFGSEWGSGSAGTYPARYTSNSCRRLATC